MATSGKTLRAAREQAGISMRGMAHRTGISYSHLSNVERGYRTATDALVEAYRRILADKGHTLDTESPARSDPFASIPVRAAAETVRFDLQDAIGLRSRPQWWQQAVTDYGTSHYLTPPAELLRDLLADTAVLRGHLTEGTDTDRPVLLRWAGHLAGIVAMAWSNVGERRQSRRWWHTAVDAADKSGNQVAQVWVRAWAVANGPSIGRPPGEVLALAHERLGEDLAADSASCALLGVLAQTQADLGDPAAVTTLRRLADLTDRVPAEVAADRTSLFGWPEVRLRYVESYVHSARGDISAAYVAQDRALDLYGTDLPRDRAKILLHRARCMVIDGDVAGGAAYATGVLDDLDAVVRGPGINAAAAAVLAAVPPQARGLTEVATLRERSA